MHTNISYWENRSFLSDYDVLIVGSGIVGLNAALHLKTKAPALHIGILESGMLPSGASTKNAGFACFGSVSELLDEMRTTNAAEVLEVVEMRWKGLNKLKKTLGEKAIDYQPLGGYEIFADSDSERFEQCKDNMGSLNARLKEITGVPDIYAVINERIADFGFRGVRSMIINRCEAQIDTGKMMLALIQKVQERGVMIFNGCRVLEMKKELSTSMMITEHGNFRCKKVLIATNAFARDLFPALDVIPGRGQVLVTEPVLNLKVKGSFHYDQGYYYFRNVDDRILLGGGRNLDFFAEETTEAGLSPVVQSSLENLLYGLILPDQKPRIDFRWSGVMGFGEQMKPIIEEIEPNVFCAVRCNGMGVAMGSLTGERAADLLLRAI